MDLPQRQVHGRRCSSLLAIAVLACLLWQGILLAQAQGSSTQLWPLLGVEFETGDGAVVLRRGATELVYVQGLGWLANLDAPAPVIEDGVAYATEAVHLALGLTPGGQALLQPTPQPQPLPDPSPPVVVAPPLPPVVSVPLWPEDPGISRTVAPGVVHREIRVATQAGTSRVHIVEVAPGSGEWRVVGTSGETRPTVVWAAGGMAAINGGYFDTGSREAIGLMIVDGVWQSMPSRGRAAVGFGADGVVIDRVSTRYAVWVDGQLLLASAHPAAAEVVVNSTSLAWSGHAGLGVISMDAEGRVLGNRVGPVRVPEDGSTLAYPPELRGLALVEAGQRLSTQVSVEPAAFGRVRYAVEAGPLLVKDGVAAFAPELEAFALGVRILDDITQQAAIGVRADGTVLLVAAETMVAADLVPLFLQLGVRDAMRLDSGGSTTLVAGGEVLNRRSERAVVNAIVWRPGGGGAP